MLSLRNVRLSYMTRSVLKIESEPTRWNRPSKTWTLVLKKNLQLTQLVTGRTRHTRSGRKQTSGADPNWNGKRPGKQKTKKKKNNLMHWSIKCCELSILCEQFKSLAFCDHSKLKRYRKLPLSCKNCFVGLITYHWRSVWCNTLGSRNSKQSNNMFSVHTYCLSLRLRSLCVLYLLYTMFRLCRRVFLLFYCSILIAGETALLKTTLPQSKLQSNGRNIVSKDRWWYGNSTKKLQYY